MKSKWNQSFVFTLGLSFLFTSLLFAQSKQPPAQRWEYRTVYSVGEAELDKLGDEGWELVASAYNPNSNSLYYTLKRPKPADAPKYVEPANRPAPPPEASCNLSLAQAPTIRGLRLGMTVEELGELFPGVSLNELKLRVEKAAGYSSFGQFDYSFRGDQHKERSENVGFYITLFDSRVRSYRVQYQFNNQAFYGQVFSNEQIINKFVASLKLPPKENWKSEHPGKVSLNCQGFKVEIYAQSNISISVEDTDQTFVEKLKQRQTQDAAKNKLSSSLKQLSNSLPS